MSAAGLGALLDLLARLESANIASSLAQHRDDAIMVKIAVPGQRWEVEFLRDGTVEVEIFESDGTIHDEGAIADLLARFSD